MKLKGSMVKNITHGRDMKPYPNIIKMSEDVRIYLKFNKSIHDVFVISEFGNGELKSRDGKCKIDCCSGIPKILYCVFLSILEIGRSLGEERFLSTNKLLILLDQSEV